MAGLPCRRSKLIAPDLDRLARMPWPMASLASSGIRFFNSVLAVHARGRPLEFGKIPRKLSPGIRCAHIDDPDRCDSRPWWSRSEQAWGFAALDAAPELLFRGQQQCW